MENSFTILEEKVLEAIEVIKGLRTEKERLSQERDGLAVRCANLEDENARLQRELAEARKAVTASGEFEEKRRAIEHKVGELLEKLEAIG